MCLIVISLNNHPIYQLVLVANRDEFYERPTKTANFWEEHPNLLAGKDILAGGTWLGLTTEGKFSALTNYRDVTNLKKNAPSRGNLVLNYLVNKYNPKEYINTFKENEDLYNGFNLLIGNLNELYYYSNISKEFLKINNGIHGLSNAFLNTSWQKVQKGKEKLTNILKNSKISPDSLFEMMYDKEIASDDLLPNTGVGLEWERKLSSMFIQSPKYGTRCTTIILLDKNNNLLFGERIFLEGKPIEERIFNLELSYDKNMNFL
ncbi:MAG: NRDE family protein [Bacteroidia bacterium]